MSMKLWPSLIHSLWYFVYLQALKDIQTGVTSLESQRQRKKQAKVIYLYSDVYILSTCCYKHWDLNPRRVSLAGAATSILFVTTNTCLSQQNTSFVVTKVCLPGQNLCCNKNTLFCCGKMFGHNKHTFVMTKDVFRRNEHMFVVTIMCLLWQKFCRNKNNTFGSSRQW